MTDHQQRLIDIRERVAAFAADELARARNRAEENEVTQALLQRALWIEYAHGVADAKKDQDSEGHRAPVQGDVFGRDRIRAGTISWDEHLEIWRKYADEHGRDQGPTTIAQRGGFSAYEAMTLLGRPLKTWRER